MNKFRVYDKQEGRYVEEYLDERGQLELFIRPDGKLRCYEESAECVGVRELDPLRFIVEEFTGFCDTDGREVYEGDTFTYGFLLGRLFIKRVKTKIGYCLALWNEAFGCTMDIALVLEQESVTGTIHDAEASDA